MTKGLWFGSLEDEEYRYNLTHDHAATGEDKPVPTRRQLAYAYGPGITTNPADHTWTLLTSHERKETLDGLSAIELMGPGGELRFSGPPRGGILSLRIQNPPGLPGRCVKLSC